MSKHFNNFPPELEQYNPEIIMPEMDFIRETLDDNKLLHSFNDEPSYAEEGPQGFLKLKWHSHGKIHREGGNPLSITITDNSYLAVDENGQAHSYNGMPGMIEIYFDELTLAWYKNGVLHRDGDLPAEIIWKIDSKNNKKEFKEEVYYINGEISRINNLPTTVGKDSTTWQVKDQFHNTKGFALEETTSLSKNKIYTWCLYGIEVKESDFNRITNYAETAKAPLWFSFLVALEIVEKDSLSFFIDENNKWNSTFPLQWVLRSWGINKRVFSESLVKLHERNSGIHSYSDTYEQEVLDNFIEIASLEQ